MEKEVYCLLSPNQKGKEVLTIQNSISIYHTDSRFNHTDVWVREKWGFEGGGASRVAIGWSPLSCC